MKIPQFQKNFDQMYQQGWFRMLELWPVYTIGRPQVDIAFPRTMLVQSMLSSVHFLLVPLASKALLGLVSTLSFTLCA